MIGELKRFLPPQGRSVRHFIGGIATLQGLAFLYIELTHNAAEVLRYAKLLQIAPFWTFALAFAVAGMALLLTLNRRQRWCGRAAAIYAAAVYGLYLGTFTSGAWTAYVLYGSIAYALVGEAGAQ